MATNCSVCGSVVPSEARFCPTCGEAVAPACHRCGSELPTGARFCPGCGADQKPSEEAAVEERKVISVLFADLVGFTAHSDQADPEDVRARLTVYHRRIREDTERFGGRVEKLMGDGVFAVFGAPTAHEDDPERAVRAALRIQESVHRLNTEQAELALSVRIAVTTGEAVVQVGEASQDREGIIGDVVNVASRLQQVAPAGGVVIDERTYLATRSVIDAEPMPATEVKGKPDPIPIWLATATRSRFGVAVEDHASTPFVGRDAELQLLVDSFDRVVRERSAQLVTVAGEPGAGKSRLLHELRAILDQRPDLIWWRQGRCLPYGEGVTYWALGEIVKAQAGMLDSEPPSQSVSKLSASVSEIAADAEEAAWLNARLAPLVGLPSESETTERSELFAAWSRFFEGIAGRNPLVLVIEDIHWADESMLAFIEHLADWALDLPILIVTTARPELYASRPQWAGGKRNAMTISLSPLPNDDVARLLSAVLPERLINAEIRGKLLERCGGNPLYATEFARLVSDSGTQILADHLPESVQALIAARLDLLDPEDKRLLQAAAVVGKVFWAGAVEFLREESPDMIQRRLNQLVRRELVRPVRRSSMQGHQEFAFLHSLVRDVSYQQIPRAERARLHENTARWVEAVSGGRVSDSAELLAHHYATAAELSPGDIELRSRTYTWLRAAGERALSLDAHAAASYLRKAAELAAGLLDRGHTLLRLAEATSVFDSAASHGAASEALSTFADADDREGQALACLLLANYHWYQGDGEEAAGYNDRAIDLIEGLPPNKTVADVLGAKAGRHQLRGEAEEALDFGRRAMAIAQQIGDTEAYVRSLIAVSSARLQLGDAEGVDDTREALRISRDRGFTRQAFVSYNSLATHLGGIGEFEEAERLIDECIQMGSSRGYEHAVSWSKSTRIEVLFPQGRLIEVLGGAEELLANTDLVDSQIGFQATSWKAWVLALRDRVGEARRMWDEILDKGRAIKDPQSLLPTLAGACHLALWDGDLTAAGAFATEYGAASAGKPAFRTGTLPNVAEAMVRLGRHQELAEWLEDTMTLGYPFAEMKLDHCRGWVKMGQRDHEAALAFFLRSATVADEVRSDLFSAISRLNAGRALTAMNDKDAAEVSLKRAKELAEKMGAKLISRQVDETLGAART